MRNWFNWFSKEAAPRPMARPRRRLGGGFEVIEPRLLMARTAVVIEFADRVDDLPGDAIRIDVQIAPIHDGRGAAAPNITIPAGAYPINPALDTETHSSESVGGFIDIGEEDPGESGGSFGTTYVGDGKGSNRGDSESAIGDGEATDGQVDLLITPPDDSKGDDTGPVGLPPLGSDRSGFNPISNDLIALPPLGTAPTSQPPVGGEPFVPNPMQPVLIGSDSSHAAQDPGPLGPDAAFEPADSSQFNDEGFGGFSPREPDRLGPQLPDSRDQKGGGIDITPQGPPGQEEEVVTNPSPSPSRTVEPTTDGANIHTAKDAGAEISLRASRGESQAFELAMSNFRRDRVVAQRIAPPTPCEILPSHNATVAAAHSTDDDAAPPADATVESPAEEHRAQPCLTAGEGESIVTQLGLLPAIEQGLIKALALIWGGDDENASACTDTHRLAHCSHSLGGVETVAATLDCGSQQPAPLTDHDTAARMVGVGLIVIAGQAGAIYFQPERPVIPRSSTRDWELDPERDGA